MMLSLRSQVVYESSQTGQGRHRRAMQPPLAVLGNAAGALKTVPGYDPEVEKNRAQDPRAHGEVRGFTAGQSAEVTVSARHIRFSETRRAF